MVNDETSEIDARINLDAFAGLCVEVAFAPGETLRVKGQHYWNMYLLISGEVEVALMKKGKAPELIRLRRGAPVGEIGFLTGRPATAQVVAKTETQALVIDDAVMAELERRRPVVAADLYRQFANVAEGRQSFNLLHLADDAAASAAPTGAAIEVRMCRNAQMLRAAQRLRFEVYCEELGRTSPFADADTRTITDDLDPFAHVLLAVEPANDTPVGTIRLNASKQGPLGALEEIYGMRSSPRHPAETGLCTKFVVKKSHRNSPASFRLLAASLDFGRRLEVKDCYGDCIPSLLPYYQSLGCRQAAPAFLHRENGRSIPLVIDLDKYANRIARLAGIASR